MIEKFHIGSIPAVLFAREDVFEAKQKRAVILYHGSSASKETHEKELLSLADSGFLAIGIDNVGHDEIPVIGTIVGIPEGAGYTVARALAGTADIVSFGLDMGTFYGKYMPNFVWDANWAPSKK